MPLLKSLDLFSGCGGITHALRGMATPVLYCEREDSCVATLTHLMKSRKLPTAPVHPDVQTLKGKPLRGKVDMIVGGWPCFPAGTPVLTDKGYLPIETVTGTELLLTHTGSWKPIENLQRKLFTGRMASVSIKRHFQPIRCTDNHPFYARTLTNAEPDWVPARNLTEKHYVGLPHAGRRFGGKQCDEKTLDDPEDKRSFIENGYVWYAITDVSFSDVDNEWVYNFQVQDDHSYVVQNIVVKNCVGFSTAGQRQGFDNQQSGLFAHVVRLIQEIQPKCVFMENVVPVTQGEGIRNVCSSLGKLGYVLWWMTLPAYATGPAPHVRKRWFCLAVRREFLGKLKVSPKAVQPHNWREPTGIPRMILPGTLQNTKRLAMLGNSVVPDVVRAAFLMLWTGTTNPQIAFKGGSMPLSPPGLLHPVDSAGCQYGFYDGKTTSAIAPPGTPKKPNVNLTLDPAGVPMPETMNPSIRTELVTAPVSFGIWATPRHGPTGGTRVLTMRSKNDLPTQVRFEKKTPKKLRLGHTSADWVDWLMGYEPGWTSY